MATNMTPVAIVSCKYPEHVKDIQNFSEKWQKEYKEFDDEGEGEWPHQDLAGPVVHYAI